MVDFSSRDHVIEAWLRPCGASRLQTLSDSCSLAVGPEALCGLASLRRTVARFAASPLRCDTSAESSRGADFIVAEPRTKQENDTCWTELWVRCNRCNTEFMGFGPNCGMGHLVSFRGWLLLIQSRHANTSCLLSQSLLGDPVSRVGRNVSGDASLRPCVA